ncbi:hypothetical protein DXG01_009683, partial [Tephrocybe rancida]
MPTNQSSPLSTHSGRIRAAAPPSSRSGRKRATSAVNDTLNKKQRAVETHDNAKTDNSSEEKVKKANKGKEGRGEKKDQVAGMNSEAKKAQKGGKKARRTAADKALEEAAAEPAARLTRTEQALFDSGISVAPPKRTRTATSNPIDTSGGPTNVTETTHGTTTSTPSSRQRRSDTLSRDDNISEEGSNNTETEDGSENESEDESGDKSGDKSKDKSGDKRKEHEDESGDKREDESGDERKEREDKSKDRKEGHGQDDDPHSLTVDTRAHPEPITVDTRGRPEPIRASTTREEYRYELDSNIYNLSHELTTSGHSEPENASNISRIQAGPAADIPQASGEYIKPTSSGHGAAEL